MQADLQQMITSPWRSHVRAAPFQRLYVNPLTEISHEETQTVRAKRLISKWMPFLVFHLTFTFETISVVCKDRKLHFCEKHSSKGLATLAYRNRASAQSQFFCQVQLLHNYQKYDVIRWKAHLGCLANKSFSQVISTMGQNCRIGTSIFQSKHEGVIKVNIWTSK